MERKTDLSKLKYKAGLEPPSITSRMRKRCESRVHGYSRQLPSLQPALHSGLLAAKQQEKASRLLRNCMVAKINKIGP